MRKHRSRPDRCARRLALPVIFALAIALGCAGSLAVTTNRWERSGTTFRVGSFDGLALSPDGRLVSGPARRTIARPEVAVIWDLELGEDEVYAAQGESAGLLVVPRSGKGEPHAITFGEEPEVMALALGRDGTLWAATGPRGAIWRVDLAARTASAVARLEAQYVWDMTVGPEGMLWVATGMPGTITRIDPTDGAADILWNSTEPHVRCLVLGQDGSLYAGTAGSGLVYVVHPDGRGFVLHDSLRSETAALALGNDGTLWAAFAGAPGKAEAGGTGEPPRRREQTGGFSESVTVRARAEGEEAKDEADKKSAERKPAGRVPSGGGNVVRIHLDDGETEEVWADGKTTPMALAPAGRNGMYVATAAPARVLWLEPGRDAGWLAELQDTRAVSAMGHDDAGLVIGASDPAAVVALVPAGAGGEPARWTSDVLDTRTLTRFGAVRAITPAPAADALRVMVRVGNTSEPDDGWTPFVPVPDAAGPPSRAGGTVNLPRARFLQLRLEADPSRPDVSVDSVDVFYRPANRAPRVKEISVQPPGVAWRPVPPADVTSGTRPVVVNPQPPESAQAAGGNAKAKKGWRSKKAFEVGARTITWSAEDPDGDLLRYELDYCQDTGGPCRLWTPLADGLERTFFSFDQRALPDGVYRFRVVVSDARSNALGEEASTQRVSGPVLIDNAPPVIEQTSARRLGQGRLQVAFRAQDVGGALARAEVALDPESWRPVVSDDGVVDGPSEQFSILLENAGSARAVLVRVVDEAGNSVSARIEIPDSADRR